MGGEGKYQERLKGRWLARILKAIGWPGRAGGVEVRVKLTNPLNFRVRIYTLFIVRIRTIERSSDII